MQYTLVIPATPVSANVLLRLHWAQRKTILDEWAWMLFALCREAGVPKMGKYTIAGTIYFPTKRKRDADNYEFGLKKIVQDALVICNFLSDDSPDHIKWETVSLAHDKVQPRTILTLTEWESACQ